MPIETKASTPPVGRDLATPVRGSNQSGMRAHNERLILSLVRTRGAMPKAEIARATGLSAQTISVIMRRLEEDGLLKRGEPIRGRVGQPSIPMQLASDGAYFFGLKVGRRSVDVILINFLGEVLGRVHRTHSYPTPDNIIRIVCEAAEELTRCVPADKVDRIVGLGVAIPFQLWDWAQSIGAPSEVMDQWKVRDIQAELAEKIGFPVYLRNDASAACGAELVFGTAEAPEDFLHFYVGYFIGGGLVLNGGLFTGRTGTAAAIGPMPIPTKDAESRPLLEIASLSVLEDRLKEGGHPTDPLWRSVEAWDIDPTVLQTWIEEAGFGLAFASVAACSILDLGAVMIDGWMPAEVRSRLVEATKAAFARMDTTGLQALDICEGSIGVDARALGAASLPLSERYLVDLNALLKSG